MLLLAHLEDLLHVSKPGLIVNSHDVYLRTIKLFSGVVLYNRVQLRHISSRY